METKNLQTTKDVKSSPLEKFKQDKLKAAKIEKADLIAELSDDDEFY